MADLLNTNIAGTGAITLPSGTTGQRPSSPQTGMLRYNTTDGVVEMYDASVGDWVQYAVTPI